MGEVLAAGGLKEGLARERLQIEALHRAGALGGQVSSALTDLYDRAVGRAYREAVERLPAAERPHVLRELALVAVGGYGRGDMAPYSDVDLLFLHVRRPRASVLELVSALVRDLWDAGLKLSQSVRSPSDAIAFARKDFPLRTSLMEARLVVGSAALFAELQRRCHRLIASSSLERFIDACLQERAQEHRDTVASVNLLEPNVKKSPGGLRDVHLLRWIALSRYGTRDPEMLRVGGVLTAEDAQTLSAGAEFLYRIRHELHFHARGAQDVLTREEQVRIARWLGFEDQGPLLGVERFMQQYYRHTTAVHDLAMRFAAGARRRGLARRALDRFLTRRVEEHFLLGRETIAIDSQAPPEELRRADVLLRLFDLARKHGVAVAHETLERVRAAAPGCELTPEARRRFLEIMADPEGLGGLVRNLHRVGLLGRFIPAFEHARCLMQFNQYHKYTVDEHSIRALEAAAARARDPGPIGQAYRETRRKDVLHLAVLLHDIGKGREEDHSEVGRRIAEELGRELGLDEHDRAQLVFLVHKHLLMAHTAFRRDVADVKTIVQFVRAVGTLETLRMLYVLTAADTEAVAPGSFTGWKESLLTELYMRASEELSGSAPVADERQRAEAVRSALRARLAVREPLEALERRLAAMPDAYLLRTDPETLAAHLRIHAELDSERGVRVESVYLKETGLTQYTVFARESLTPGIFSKITGVLAAERFQIVDAQIVTWSDGFVVDAFRGVDTDFPGEPPPYRRTEIAGRIEEVLLGRRTVEALFAARRAPSPPNPLRVSSGSTQVEIDNASSDRYTIVEVFADDRLGLLYTIARTLFEMGLSISSAKISTRLDQVVDVFYVTDRQGAKLTDGERSEAVRRRLLEVLDAFR
ncbi:MAG TPA: [protein-PII] uridylyltransferase [Planctomycetota bacterium]|nr:[protein-PII] uridylyltransferase [Planctomycetota bacterium]